MGGAISKVYRLNNKLVINLPYEIIKALSIKDGDDVDFFKYGDKGYLFAKKSDVAELIKRSQEQQTAVEREAEKAEHGADEQIGPEEITLLKKLDTMRYSDRTRDKVDGMLNAKEKQVLQSLMDKGAVMLYKKSGEDEYKYSISKLVYDRFLFGKRQKAVSPESAAPARPQSTSARQPAPSGKLGGAASMGNENYMNTLEENGFLVITNSAEAAGLSAMLEESIKSGNVVGTRAFNKRYYILLRGFINKNAERVLKAMDKRSMSATDIAKLTGINEEGVRALLYMLAESGDASEVRRDVFRLV